MSIVDQCKPSSNGQHKSVKTTKKATPNWKPLFGNYSGDIPLTIDQIGGSLFKLTNGWPKCISGILCYQEGLEICPLKNAAALFAWIASQCQVEWKKGNRGVTKEEFFCRLQQREQWNWATAHPHFPPVDGVYYLTQPPKAKNTGKLDEFVDRFLPQTSSDRQLIKAMILTLHWGGPPGKRPAFTIVAQESKDKDAGRGTGKTSLIEYTSRLVGGCIDIDPSDGHGRILTNLLSPSAWAQRIALIDNLKSARFSHDMIEKLVTRSEVTGHRLYYGFGTRPNLLTWIVTVNGALFSTDLAQRSIVIQLNRPTTTPEDWDATTTAFIDNNREAILADIRWHLEVKNPTTLKKVDRWRSWCLGVLSRCDNPNALLSHICKQRNAIDADKLEIELALDHLRSCIAEHYRQAYDDDECVSTFDVDGSIVWIPTAWLVQALRCLKRDLSDRQAQHFLPRLTSSPLLKEKRQNKQRGYCWTGKKVDPASPPAMKVIVYRPMVPSLKS